ncbi:MAG TPA: hypothetical protein VFW07_06250 [Parafilimonas sp.]|nr:hypothetical protein [Parafilimonas sp.]
MKIVSIFLASSSELKEDRDQLQIHIGNKNKEWTKKDVFLKLVLWEDFLDAMSQTRLQDEYNEAISKSDIFLLLFFTKVGKYTEEEFQKAFETFQQTNKPFIFTYFKDAQITTGKANKNDLMSLWNFQEKLDKLGHFYTAYKDTYELLLKFDQQLNKLAENGFIKLTYTKYENNQHKTNYDTYVLQLKQLASENSQLRLQIERLENRVNEFQNKKEFDNQGRIFFNKEKEQINKEIKTLIEKLPSDDTSGNATSEKTKKFVIIIVGFISVAVATAIYLIYHNTPEQLKPPVNFDFSTTIFLKDSNNAYIYGDSIRLSIRLKGNLREGELIPSSKAYLFSQIPSNYKNVKLLINSRKWVFANNRMDTSIEIFDGEKDMPVKRNPESLLISGYIYDNIPLSNISVTTNEFPNIHIETDTKGKFEFTLPASFLNDSVEVNFNYNGNIISKYLHVGIPRKIDLNKPRSPDPTFYVENLNLNSATIRKMSEKIGASYSNGSQSIKIKFDFNHQKLKPNPSVSGYFIFSDDYINVFIGGSFCFTLTNESIHVDISDTRDEMEREIYNKMIAIIQNNISEICNQLRANKCL